VLQQVHEDDQAAVPSTLPQKNADEWTDAGLHVRHKEIQRKTDIVKPGIVAQAETRGTEKPRTTGAFQLGNVGYAVIVIYRLSPRNVGPVPRVVVAILGSALKLLEPNAGNIATEVGVVLQGLPGKRIVVVTDSEKSPEAENSVRNLATLFIDHDPLDRPDLLAVGAVDRGSFDLVTSNQVTRLSGFHCHLAPKVVKQKQTG
jgi:hypothetical protein